MRVLSLLLFATVASTARPQWQPVFQTPNNEIVTVFSAPTDSVVWFITNFNRLYRTSDAWNTVTVVPPGQPAFIPSGLCAVNDLVALKTGSQVWKTIDGGGSWYAVYTATGALAPVLWMLDANTGLMVDNGVLYRTTDGGENWSTSGITQPPSAITGATGKGNICVLGNDVWVALSSGGIAHSPDLGTTWSEPANMGWGFGNTPRIHFADTQLGMAVLHNNPFVYVTVDGGEHWIDTDNSLGANQDVLAIGTGYWYIPNPADHFYIKHSSDSGGTWQQQLVDTDGFEVLDRSRAGSSLWAGTETGTIYRYDTSIALGDDTRSADSMRVFPDPATDHITVTGIHGVASYVLLTSDGCIAQQGALHDGRIDLHALASGFYTLRVEQANGSGSVRSIVKR